MVCTALAPGRWSFDQPGTLEERERFGFDRLCELAAEKDRGFNLAALIEALGFTQRLQPQFA